MAEWEVVSVLAVLAGLIAAVTKPLLRLNGTVTRLTQAVETLEKNITGLTEKNDEAHEKLWQSGRDCERSLFDHDTRLRLLEHRQPPAL